MNHEGNQRTMLRLILLCLITIIAACADPEFDELTGIASHELVTDCDYLNPALHSPLPVPIDPNREMLVRDLSVVEDPCRTTWVAGGCPAGSVGAWTAGELFNRMSGAPIAIPPPPAPLPVGQQVSALMGEVFHSWEVPQIVNGFTVPPRPAIRGLVIDPWIAATVAMGGPPAMCFAGAAVTGVGACPLDPRAIPLRLLAIVNRLDLAGDTSHVPITPGEGRFVYGVIDQFGNPTQFTVILEYKLPTSANAFAWATQWHGVSSIPFGLAYNAALQVITDGFTMAGVEPANPNMGTSIGTVRTNENALNPVWELREFQLQDQGTGYNRFLLRPHSLAQTPTDGLNFSADLDAWQVANEPAILGQTAEVPQGFTSGIYALGGGSTAPFTWGNGGTAGPLSAMGRHLFGFATCNGCHSVEVQTPFVHIFPRALGTVAALSPFLNVPLTPGAGGFPAIAQNFPDPVSGDPRSYHEMWRRACEQSRLIRGVVSKPFTKPNGAH